LEVSPELNIKVIEALTKVLKAELNVDEKRGFMYASVCLFLDHTPYILTCLFFSMISGAGADNIG
jgi:hypothetical protein